MRGSVLMTKAMFLILLLLALPARAASGHQHGVAKLDVAYHKGALSVELEAPLDVLLGFERAPRTDAERKSVEQLTARLNTSETLFRIDPSAQCARTSVELSSAVLKLGKPNTGWQFEEGHAELIASFRYDCKGTSPAWIDLGLFEQFPRLNRLQAQVVSGKRPAKSLLTRTSQRLKLER